MVKINLLNTPEEEDSSSQEKRMETPSEESSKTEMDFSFIQPEEEPPENRTTIPAPEPVSEPETEEGVLFDSTPTVESGEEESFSYESPKKKRLFIILGIIGVLLLAALFVLLWLGPEREPTATKTPEQPPAEPQTTVPSTVPTASTPVLPAPLKNAYLRNKSENTFYLNYATNFVNSSTRDMGVSLVVMTPGALYISILADSRDEIARFRRTVKDRFPDIQMSVESITEKIIEDQKKLQADFYVPLPNSPASGGGDFKEALEERDVIPAIRRLASTNGVRIIRFLKGAHFRKATTSTTAYYLRISGNKNALFSFFSQIARDFPAVKFNKISVYPQNSQIISGGTLEARVDLTLITPNE